jgi:hypothetical protein
MKKIAHRTIIKKKHIPIPSKMPEDYSLSKTGITQSLLTQFAVCEQRFVYAANRWVSKKRSSALIFGSLIHELLDKTYTLYEKKKKIASGNNLELWMEKFFEEENTAGIQQNEIEFMGAKAFVMLSNYIQVWKEDFGGKKFEQVEKTDSVLLPIEKSIGGATALCRFKKDGLYLDKSKDRWILETKCYSRIEEESMNLALNMDFQNLFYTATEIELSSKPVKGVLRNILRNPGNKMNATDNLKTFSDRINSEMKKKPDYYFIRYEVPYTTKQVEEFKRNLFLLLQRLNIFILKNQLPGGGLPEKNYCACEGKYMCPYINACISGNMSDYEQKEKLFSELETKEV